MGEWMAVVVAGDLIDLNTGSLTKHKFKTGLHGRDNILMYHKYKWSKLKFSTASKRLLKGRERRHVSLGARMKGAGKRYKGIDAFA